MHPDEIRFAAGSLARPGAPALSLRWLGAAGFAIRHGGNTLLIAPYVTRASLAHCITGPVPSDLAAIYAYTPRADAIIVGHTHDDHVLDVPAIARHTGARVFGSRSAVTLCRLAGLPESQLRDVERGPGAGPEVTRSGDKTVAPPRLRARHVEPERRGGERRESCEGARRFARLYDRSAAPFSGDDGG